MDVAGNLTVPDLLRIQVERNPDKDFLIFEDDAENVSSLTYRAFTNRVNKLANYLVQQGIKRGDKVAIMLTNSPEFLIAWFAVSMTGAVAVPVNVLYSSDELAYLLANSESAGLIIEPKFLAALRETPDAGRGVRVRVLAKSAAPVEGFALLSEIEATASDADLKVEIAPDAPVQIIYTSGTTSRPKGAILSHRSSVIQGIATAMLFGLNANDRACVTLPLFHVNAQYVGVFPTLTVGGTVVLLEVFSARKFWNQVRTHRCTAISIVPMVLRTMLSQPPREDDATHSVRFSFYALPTSSEEWEAFERRFGVTLVEGYGLTETFGICSSNPLIHSRTKRHCIGLPLLGREMRVVDDEMNDKPVGEPGHIIVRGEALFSGYYKNDEATKACMRDGWFFTGDNGKIDEDGYFHFFDRSKDVIKRAGENIAATEVERVLNDHPGILESAAIGVFDPLRDEAVKVYVVLQPGHVLTEDEVRAWCAKYLAKFKVPSFVEFRDELPKTSIGKIMKYELRAQHNASAAAQAKT
jgi:carnitine-CoA ligase